MSNIEQSATAKSDNADSDSNSDLLYRQIIERARIEHDFYQLKASEGQQTQVQGTIAPKIPNKVVKELCFDGKCESDCNTFDDANFVRDGEY